jgi:hypothetical protein
MLIGFLDRTMRDPVLASSQGSDRTGLFNFPTSSSSSDGCTGFTSKGKRRPLLRASSGRSEVPACPEKSKTLQRGCRALIRMARPIPESSEIATSDSNR